MRISIAEAVTMTGKSKWTIKKYVNHGHITVHSKPATFMTWTIELDELLDHLELMRDNYRSRPSIPGPGRGNHRKVKPCSPDT